MSEQKLNSPEYIDTALSGGYNLPESRKLRLHISYSIRTLFYGRKWLVYFILTLIPVIFSLISEDRYLSEETATDAFLGIIFDIVLFFLFTFGALFISLPHTADEISDHVMEGYVVRPVRRETIYISRSIVSILGIWIVNTASALFYYVYFHVIDGFSGEEFFDNLYVLGSLIYMLFFASLMYGSVFTFVGLIGNKGFTFGVIIAMFETFFINILFLQNSPYIPRTNLQNLADSLLGDYYIYRPPEAIDLVNSYIYFFVFSIITSLVGIFYFKNRQFDG